MKNIIHSTVVSLLLIVAAMAYGAVPPINVTVSDASGKAAFKGITNATGSFTTAKLQPGKYVVQFNAKGGGVTGGHYTIVVSAGTKKVSAGPVPGEKFTGGGVAVKVDVGGGLNITGQVVVESSTAVNKNGKKMVWIAPQIGSHMPGHWVEADSAEAMAAKTAGNMSNGDVRKMQDRGVNPAGN